MTVRPPEPVFRADELGPVVLVTGGAGFLGRALVRRLLASGATVRALDVRPFEGDPRVRSFVADLRDYDAILPAFEGVDTVFHTAAVISTVGEDLAQPKLKRFVYGVNVVGTENVLRACVASKVGRLVHTSSFNVAMAGRVDEGDETLPYAEGEGDLYTRTKIAAEKRVLAANGVDGLRTVAIRPGGIWGGGRGAIMIEAFVTELAKGKFGATIGDGRSVLDNVHVENVVDAELLAARALGRDPGRIAGQAYFVTDDERINPMEWFRPLVEGLGHRFPNVRVPRAVMFRVAWAIELAHQLGAPEPTITRRGIKNLTDGISFRVDKARRDLGYAPRFGQADLAALVDELRPVHDRIARGER